MRRMDRRALFTSGAAAALLAAAGVSSQAAPRSGGVLRLAVPRADGVMDRLARWAVYDALTEIGPDGVLRAELATAWSSSMDARLWTFDLREGVRFHSGAEMTAADVMASLQRADLPGVEFLGFRILSSHRLRFELAAPNPDLPYQLAALDCVITPGGAPVPTIEAADGTGCYKVIRAREGRHLRAARVEQHYKAGQAGWADAIEIIAIPDAAIRAEALRDGYVDVAAFPEAEALREVENLQFYPSPDTITVAAHNMVGVPPSLSRRDPLDGGRLAERWWML